MTDQARLKRPSKMGFVAGRVLAKVTWWARPLPDVVMIGAIRGGSTALYANLLQHPDVKGPFRKELHYLNTRWARGERWYRAQFPMVIGSRSWQAIEATPAYLAFPDAPARMRETQPDVRLLLTLRDPVDRAVSHWKFRTQRSHETRSLDEVVADEATVTDGDISTQILTHGHYAAHLERWFEVFDQDRFLIVDAADLFTDPESAMNQVYDWLGVSRRPLPPVSVRNASRTDATPTETAVASLRDHYRPHDERLVTLLGRSFSWT